MMPYTTLVEGLFSAAHKATHFKDFQYYYFHNCIYEQLYSDMRMHKKVSTSALLHSLEADYRVILVGDAYMAPEELIDTGGALYYYHHNETPGITWLRRFQEHLADAHGSDGFPKGAPAEKPGASVEYTLPLFFRINLRKILIA